MILNLFSFAAQNARAEFAPATTWRPLSDAASTIPSKPNGADSDGRPAGAESLAASGQAAGSIGPHPCCGEFGAVFESDGRVDGWRCSVCGYEWGAWCR